MSEFDFVCRYTGDGLAFATRFFEKLAIDQLVIGERYIATVQLQRSMSSHRHYFAVLNDIYESWPESAMQQFSSIEQMRKWALIRTGWRDEMMAVFDTNSQAEVLANIVTRIDPHAEMSIVDGVCVLWRARSQSLASMGKENFQKSKDDVIAYLMDIVSGASQTPEPALGSASGDKGAAGLPLSPPPPVASPHPDPGKRAAFERTAAS